MCIHVCVYAYIYVFVCALYIKINIYICAYINIAKIRRQKTIVKHRTCSMRVYISGQGHLQEMERISTEPCEICTYVFL